MKLVVAATALAWLVLLGRPRDDRVTLELTIECPAQPARLAVRDDWFELFGEHYRTIARIEGPGGARDPLRGADQERGVMTKRKLASGRL